MSLFAIKKTDDIFIAEIGTNKKGEIKYLSEIAKPDMALITNISESHLSNLIDLNGVFEEKIIYLNRFQFMVLHLLIWMINFYRKHKKKQSIIV